MEIGKSPDAKWLWSLFPVRECRLAEEPKMEGAGVIREKALPEKEKGRMYKKSKGKGEKGYWQRWLRKGRKHGS